MFDKEKYRKAQRVKPKKREFKRRSEVSREASKGKKEKIIKFNLLNKKTLVLGVLALVVVSGVFVFKNLNISEAFAEKDRTYNEVSLVFSKEFTKDRLEDIDFSQNPVLGNGVSPRESYRANEISNWEFTPYVKTSFEVKEIPKFTVNYSVRDLSGSLLPVRSSVFKKNNSEESKHFSGLDKSVYSIGKFRVGSVKVVERPSKDGSEPTYIIELTLVLTNPNEVSSITK